MKLVCALTALMLALPVPAAALVPPLGPMTRLYQSQSADSPARESRAPPVVLGTEVERKSNATAHYEKNRFVEAALGFEGLWGDFPKNDEYLFNAAASRSAAGHNAHAVAYTREYLRNPDLKSEARAADRTEGEAQLRQAMVGLVPVAVTVTTPPGGTGQITIVAEHIPRDSSDLRPELLFPTRAGSPMELQLDPGSWTVRAQGPGYIEAEQRVEVVKDVAAKVALRLEATPADLPGGHGVVTTPSEVPPRLVRRLELGFGIAGGVAAVVGIIMLGVGAGKIGKTAECADDVFSDCDRELRVGTRIRGHGALAFGGGAGLLAGGLTWIARDPAKRRKAWIGELVIGGAGLVVGAILMPSSAKRFNDATNPTTIPDWNDRFRGARHSVDHAMAGLLVGLGVGLITSAVTGLAVQRKYGANRVRVDAMAGRTQAGLMVSGRF